MGASATPSVIPERLGDDGFNAGFLRFAEGPFGAIAQSRAARREPDRDEAADQRDRAGGPQQRGAERHARPEQHIVAIALHEIVEHRLIAVAGLDPVAHEHA